MGTQTSYLGCTSVETQMCCWYFASCIYIYKKYINLIYMLSTLSSKMLDAMNGAVIYMWGISSTTNCHYTVFHGLNPIFRWLYDTTEHLSVLKTKIHENWLQCITSFKHEYWILQIWWLCLTLCSINSLTIKEWRCYCSNCLNAMT